MSVQNIECQIAQAQISRLLTNEPLSEAIMADLEAHVAVCPDCQAFIIGQNRSLDVVAGGGEKTPKPKGTKKPEPETEEAIKANDRERLAFEKIFKPKATKAAVQAQREPATGASFWKPLAYSGALAAVLLAMSYVAKDPTAVFGERALKAPSAEAAPAKADATDSSQVSSNGPAAENTPPPAAPAPSQQVPDEAVEPPPGVRSAPETRDAEPIAREAVQPPAESAPVGAYVKAPAKPQPAAQPAPLKAPKPQVTVRKVNSAAPKRHARPRGRKQKGTVQFYDASGRPL